MPDRIDLRSDTVTRPIEGMRRAIAEAEVGDDQYGEDPSVNRLQDEVASLLGMEASLFLPSGTMANQVALRTLTRPGDDVLVPTDVAHRPAPDRRRRRECRRPVQPDRRGRDLRRRCGARGDQAARAHRLSADVAARCREHPQPAPAGSSSRPMRSRPRWRSLERRGWQRISTARGSSTRPSRAARRPRRLPPDSTSSRCH